MSNLLFIYADDLFCYRLFRNTFGQTIQTPNLDALAARSTAFDAAYATVPVCLPSRGATMTAWSPWQSGMVANGQTKDWYEVGDTRDNLSALIKRSGYHVEWAGKVMHGYGVQPPEQQRQLHHAAMPNGPFTPNLNATDGSVEHVWPQSPFSISTVVGKDDEFYDHRVATYAIDMIGRMPAAGKPWAMFAGFQHPHTQYAAPKRFYDLYDRAQITPPTTWSLGALPRPKAYGAQFMSDGTVWPSRDVLDWQHNVRAYLACISHLDWQIGRLMAALDASPHANNTTVIFVSDHGYHAGDHDIWGKFTLWEEAARTPLLVRGPGQTVGSVVNTPVGLMDIFTTVCEALDIPVPSRSKGQSLLPLLQGGAGIYENRGAVTAVYGSVAIRWQQYRYILYPEGTQELYDLNADPSQAFNLATSQPAIAAACRAQLVLESARYCLFHATEELPTVREARSYALYNGGKVNGSTGDDAFYVGGANAAELEAGGGTGNRLFLGHWNPANPYTLPDGIQDMTLAVKRADTSPTVRLNDGGVTANAPQRAWIVYGGAGNDTISGPNASQLYGGDGDDYIQHHGTVGVAEGGAGNDTIISAGATARGGDGDDVIILTGPGQAFGDAGNDSITGSAGDDTLYGGSGNDAIDGGLGDDVIYGGIGRNVLNGGGGDDIIHAEGQDTVSGGPGNDTFVIGRAAQVLITDWQIGETIDLTAWGAAPSYRAINSNQVLIYNRSRSVVVTCAAAISPPVVQGSVIT